MFLNLAYTDNRTKVLGYHSNIRAFLHEAGHLMDYHLKIQENMPQLREILRDEFLLYTDQLLGTYERFDPALLQDKHDGVFHYVNAYHAFDFEEKKKIAVELYGDGKVVHLRNGVSDIMEGLTGGDLIMSYGHHDPHYWLQDDARLPQEAIAHMFEAYMTGGAKYEEFKNYFPRAMQYFEERIQQLI